MYSPEDSAAAEMITFIVDPGGYVFWVARSSSGFAGSFCSRVNAAWAASESWPVIWFGS